MISAFTVGEGFLIAMATRREIPDELYELAAMEGAGPWATLRRVTLPLMAPTLVLLAAPRHDLLVPDRASCPRWSSPTAARPVRHDLPAAVHLPQRLRVPPLRLRRGGHGGDAGLTAVLIAVQYAILRRWRHAHVRVGAIKVWPCPTISAHSR